MSRIGCASRSKIGSALLAWALLAAPAPPSARAEPPPSRGLLYGSALVGPIHVGDVRLFGPGGAPGSLLSVGPGLGVRAHLGWELERGFSILLVGGLAANAVDTSAYVGPAPSDVLTRVDVAIAGRYTIWNDSPALPFVQVGVAVNLWSFDRPDGVAVESAVAASLEGTFGLHLRVQPWLGVELAVTYAYAFDVGLFIDGAMWLQPSAGVTLYAL